MKILAKWLPALVATVGLTLATAAQAADRIKVGIMGGDSELIWAEVTKQAAKKDIEVELVVFADYVLPNAALDSGDLDANAFQHQPYLNNQIKTKGYAITAIAKTVTYPIGLYSGKVKALADLKEGAEIGIPNDPTNGGRALLLLQAQKQLTLKPDVGLLPSVLDITDNPRKLRIREIDAAQLPRSLDDLDAAVINTNYALQANLKPGRDAIAVESAKDNPYANLIAVRVKDKDKPVFQRLVEAYQSPEIRAFVAERFEGAILPSF